MVFFLALRNISRNKKNSFVIAMLVAVITFLFFIGNSAIERSNMGIKQAFVDSLTGDVVLQKKSDVTMNLFGANTPVIDEYFNIPVFPAYDAVMEMLRAEEGIAGITSQVSGKAFLDLLGVREPVLLCGADTETYFSMFPGVILEEGGYLHGSGYGVMITSERAKRIEREKGIYPKPGDKVLLTSGGALGFKIREVPITGIFRYSNPGQFMNEIVIADPQTVRVLNSIQVETSSDVELSDNEVMLLNADIDDIFGMDMFFGGEEESGFSVDFLQNRLAETKTSEETAAGGDWNFIIIRLKKGVSPSGFIKSINKKLEPFGITAVDWRIAAGISAILLVLIQTMFNAGMFLVCVACVITAINILLISVFRRVREIGTLRAIGASDFYIGSLILQENLILTVIAGIAGVFFGSLFLQWINSLALQIPNEIVASLFGGSVLNLGFVPGVAAFSFILAVVLGIIVSIYPIHITVKVEPMEALRQG
jgi:ABC-type lipoprotein release transport system permease subunit